MHVVLWMHKSAADLGTVQYNNVLFLMAAQAPPTLAVPPHHVASVTEALPMSISHDMCELIMRSRVSQEARALRQINSPMTVQKPYQTWMACQRKLKWTSASTL